MPSTLRIATRASRLALWQSEHVAARLREHHPDLVVELVPITTTGDRIIDQPLAAIGGKGLFIKELEVAMMENRADIAVHSMKDVPAELPQGFDIGVILPREDPRDVLVGELGAAFEHYRPEQLIGTSSLRRRAQLLAAQPGLSIKDLRGNVPTRLSRLEQGDYAGIVLAAAGLKRLGLMDQRCHILDEDQLLPAVGQGAIGIECRQPDAAVRTLLAPLHCRDTHDCVSAERAMNATLGGSCHLPIAGHAVLNEGQINLRGLVASVDGDKLVRFTARGERNHAVALGERVAAGLISAGAGDILASLAGD